MQWITRAAVTCAVLCYLSFPTVAQPTRDFSFEFSCSEYQRLQQEFEGRIDALEKAEKHMHTAIVCRKLLSDFGKEREALTREEARIKREEGRYKGDTDLFVRQMATCYAHLGDFAQAKQWAKKQTYGYWRRMAVEDVSIGDTTEVEVQSLQATGTDTTPGERRDKPRPQYTPQRARETAQSGAAGRDEEAMHGGDNRGDAEDDKSLSFTTLRNASQPGATSGTNGPVGIRTRTPDYGKRILSPLRLPIPPQGQLCLKSS